MGMMLGKISVETPKYEVLHSTPDYEIRRYSPSVVAQVTYHPSDLRGDRDGGFMILANYIGALGNPQNHRPEKIAMTAPVMITTDDQRQQQQQAEKIAMTAPVITSSTTTDTEGGGGGGGGEKKEMAVTMQFVLPSKYEKAEEAPRPLDERVVIREEGERKYGVVRFSGVATDKVVEEKVRRLRECLERDGHRVDVTVGVGFLLGRYNPPWTLPPFRTNEVMLPIA